MGLVGHAETFKLGPLGNWGSQTVLVGSGANVLEAPLWTQGAVQTASAESISPKGWKRQTRHGQEAKSSVGRGGTEEGELEWAHILAFQHPVVKKGGWHWELVWWRRLKAQDVSWRQEA